MTEYKIEIFRLIVQNSSNCVRLLSYIDENITQINVFGIRFRIDKIDSMNDKIAKVLAKNGINSLPAMISPEGKLLIGYKKIINLFESNIKKTAGNRKHSEHGDINSFWMKQLYNTKDDGSIEPQKDNDDDELDESKDLEKKLRDYNLNAMKNRKTNKPDRSNCKGKPQEQTTKAREQSNFYEDNIAPMPAPISKDSCMKAAGCDANDRLMMSAWLDNNPIDY